jgi:hypothetical protein
VIDGWAICGEFQLPRCERKWLSVYLKRPEVRSLSSGTGCSGARDLSRSPPHPLRVNVSLPPSEKGSDTFTRLWKGRLGLAHKPKEPPKMSFDIFGGSAWVSDGTRTRDSQDHNLVLYQLNYAHHCLGHRFDPAALTKEILARKSVRKPIGRSGGTQALYDGCNLRARRSGRRDECSAAVVLEFADGFLDVGECPVGETFFGLAEVDSRVPAAGEFFDGADVDHPVVQVCVQCRHVP